MSIKNTTIHDIARELNVTASTVSRALSDHPRISERTKERVLKVAQQLDYNPNVVASTLRKGKTNTIGIIVPKINRDFFSNSIYHMESVTAEAGYNIIICQSNESYDKEVENLKTLVSSRVDGIIISISYETLQSGHLQQVVDRGIPVVQFDRVREDLKTNIVTNDDEEGAFQAVSHLIRSGYRKVAMLSGHSEISIYEKRLEGYKKALQYHGLHYDESIVYKDIITKEHGIEVTRNILQNGYQPDAIFASSDFAALGALQVLRANNIRIPEEVGIVGYANEPFTELMTPGITSVDQHSEKIGKLTAELLLEHIENRQIHQVKHIDVPPTLIVRGSSTKHSTK